MGYLEMELPIVSSQHDLAALMLASLSTCHTKFRQNRTKIVEVSQSHVVGRGVGWLGWYDFFYRLISRVDYQDKPPYKI